MHAQAARQVGRTLTALFGAVVVGASAMPMSAAPVVPMPASERPWAAPYPGQLELQAVAAGLVSPLGIVNAGDGTHRLFVLEKGGTVRVHQAGGMLPGAFLDIRSVPGGFTSDGERGLLGIAFDPAFATNGILFAFYTDGGGDLVIAQLAANAARTAVDPATVDRLLTIEHSARSNHNGGQILFGPDGHLYAFTGDGGGGGDPDENAQDPDSLLGKVLRIAPDLAGGYTIPSANPYVGGPGADEIWGIGLRNPWRASFDRATGDVWIADVGQGSWEEVNRVGSGVAGANYGWDCREGLHPYEAAGCAGLTFIDPVAEYGHGSGDCSVTGGHVYRGDVFDDLVGHYVLGDFCSGRIWTLDAGAGSPSLVFHRDTAAMITSFGESESGELFMTDFAGGVLYRVVAPPFTDVTASPFIDAITWLSEAGITNGCGGGRYCPTDSVTREQMASFIARALGLPPSTTDHFIDDTGSIHEADINRMAEAGITNGCGGGRYCPTDPVTREQMAAFLQRALD